MRQATVAIHSGYAGGDRCGATTVPLYQTVSYAQRSAEELAALFRGTAPGYVYTRIANPTTMALEARLAELENGIGCVATASGMAAITAVIMGLVSAGDEVIAAKGIFGGTVSLLKNVLAKLAVRTHFVDTSETQAVAEVLTDRTRLIFVETIANPRMDVADLKALAEIAHQAQIPLVVDNTVATPILVRPGDLNADVVVHSTSKFINGHGTAIGGAIIDTGNFDWSKSHSDDIRQRAKKAGPLAFLSHLRNGICRDLGGCPAPMNSFLMLQGLETLPQRMANHCRNARELGEFLANHPDVAWVDYPGLEDSPHYDRVLTQFGGLGGGLLTFGLGTRARAFRCINALKLARNAANLGDAKTLVVHPASTIFQEFDPSDRETMGVTEDMIRVSVGLEDILDIQEDFKQAIDESGRI